MHNIYIFLLIFLLGIILYFSCYKFDVAIFDSKKPGKNILIVAGTHGNEPSGSDAVSTFKNKVKNGSIKIKSGKLTIVDNLNKSMGPIEEINRYKRIFGTGQQKSFDIFV